MELYTHQYLDTTRQCGDPEADDLVEWLFEAHDKSDVFHLFEKSGAELAKSSSVSRPVRRFIGGHLPTPDWLSEELLAFGRSFFHKHATDMMHLLGIRSLPYCYAAHPGNKVLFETEKISEKTGKRLHDTASFILELMKRDAFTEKTGYYEINKTRLIHAAVRFSLVEHGDWDRDDGLPINHEDMAGTLLAFSFVPLAGLRKMGYELGDLGVKGFLHLWKYIGYQLRIDETLLVDTEKEAGHLQNRIGDRHFQYSKEGAYLTEALLAHYEQQFSGFVSRIIRSQMLYFLDERVLESIGFEPPDALDRVIHGASAVARWVPSPRKNESRFRQVLEQHRKRAQNLAEVTH